MRSGRERNFSLHGMLTRAAAVSSPMISPLAAYREKNKTAFTFLLKNEGS